MKTRIHVFAVAVEEYQKKAIPKVTYAENDARDFVKAWQELGADPASCVTLLSAQATKAAIESAFKKFLNTIQKGDYVVFFFAGHGIAFNDVSFLTTHDSQPGDYQLTSISLGKILQQLRDCKSENVLIFIDACESGLPVSEGMRSITSNLSDVELKQFCADAEHHVGFASCKVDESSWSSHFLKHGIWSSCVIKALSGEAKDALDKGTLLTSDSLRDYLSAEVPRLVRATLRGNETQTPCCFGNATKSFVIADLKQLLSARAAKASSLGNIFKDATLLGKKFGNVRELSGFKKSRAGQQGHRVPDGHTSATERFVKDVGEGDLKTHSDEIHDKIRDTFGYLRKDINYACGNGDATIKTPDFDVIISLQQDPDDAGLYVLATEVSLIRRQAVLSEDRFINLFSRYCDTIVIEFSGPMNLQDKIDEIESVPQLKKQLAYAADCSSFTLNMAAPNMRIHVTSDRMTLSLPSTRNLKLLLENARTALAAVGGSGITLLLPQSTS